MENVPASRLPPSMLVTTPRRYGMHIFCLLRLEDGTFQIQNRFPQTRETNSFSRCCGYLEAETNGSTSRSVAAVIVSRTSSSEREI
jgi:hypothetical protein